jgi:hypothetical protein
MQKIMQSAIGFRKEKGLLFSTKSIKHTVNRRTTTMHTGSRITTNSLIHQSNISDSLRKIKSHTAAHSEFGTSPSEFRTPSAFGSDSLARKGKRQSRSTTMAE